MPNLVKIITGTGAFLVGYALTLILSYVIPPLLDIFTETWSTTIVQLMWFMLIIIWTLSLIILPIGVKIWGLTETDGENENQLTQIFGITFGFLYSLFALAIAYFTWDWTTTMVEVIDYDIITAMFWIGYLIIFTLDIIVVPYIYITEAKRG